MRRAEAVFEQACQRLNQNITTVQDRSLNQLPTLAKLADKISQRGTFSEAQRKDMVENLKRAEEAILNSA